MCGRLFWVVGGGAVKSFVTNRPQFHSSGVSFGRSRDTDAVNCTVESAGIARRQLR